MNHESRLTTIDALRGMAAMGVAAVHFSTSLGPTWLQKLCHYGWLGVDVFFVISGFVIPYALAKGRYQLTQDYPKFIAKRLLRLHPPYLTVVILLLIIPVLAPARSTLAPGTDFLLHSLLLNGVIGEPWLNNVFWSLAIEFQYYILIGLIAPLISGTATRCLVLLTALLALSLLPIPKVLLPAHLPLFVCGILALMKHERKIEPGTLFTGLIITSCACWWSLGAPQALAGAATALIIVYWRTRIPSAISALGTLSYSLYLLHPLVGRIVESRMDSHSDHPLAKPLILFAFAMVLSIAAAWMCYLLIERPSQKLSSSVSYGRNGNPPHPDHSNQT